MRTYILSFQEIDKAKLARVGGKGANLGELSKIEGINIPDGFCISTEAFKRIIGETPSIGEQRKPANTLGCASTTKTPRPSITAGYS